jgi:hypothetical protein
VRGYIFRYDEERDGDDDGGWMNGWMNGLQFAISIKLFFYI